MDRLTLRTEIWCNKCPNPATHERYVSRGGAPAERLAYCDNCGWIFGNMRGRADRVRDRQVELGLEINLEGTGDYDG